MRIGCENDYELFKEELTELLQKIHGSSRHVGKTPPEAADEAKREVEHARREAELAKFRKELDDLVKAEKYEEAAKLRDKIREAEGKKS
jgi:protein arginine kinase activator